MEDLEAAGLLAGLFSLPQPIAEEDWPPELQLPRPPPPPPPPAPPAVLDDSQFLGSMMASASPSVTPASTSPELLPPPPCVAETNQEMELVTPPCEPEPLTLVVPTIAEQVKRRRGRPPKKKDSAPPAATAADLVPAPAPAPKLLPKKKVEEEGEVVCFICFDGGKLVLCDRRGCPKAYHTACIKRDESFFRSRGKWNCGWHICSTCERDSHYLCYTCTFSQCKGCIQVAKFYSIRGSKGLCEVCFGTIMMIEFPDDENNKKVGVDFDDKTSWEYLFKLYWLDQKAKLSLTGEELRASQSRGHIFSPSKRRQPLDELYDSSDDEGSSSDSFSGGRKSSHTSRRKAKKSRKAKDDTYYPSKRVRLVRNAVESSVMEIDNGFSCPEVKNWASKELLEFVGHMRNGDSSFLSSFDVQALVLSYITMNNLRDPHRKSQIICDARLQSLFGKPRVGHFEMLKLLESHFLIKDTLTLVNDTGFDSAMQKEECCDLTAKASVCKKRKNQKKMGACLQTNLDDFAAIDMHNISLLYIRRSLMEDLIDDDGAFATKIPGTFVRIRISAANQKQDMYRLVKVVGANRLSEEYKVGKKTTNLALEILNLDKKEIITIDAISNQDFTEEECKRLKQSMTCGLINRLKVRDCVEKARLLQSLKVNECLESEKVRLRHLRDRASETGRRKELRECVEKLQLLNTPEERARRLNEIPEVHSDPSMNPDFESAEDIDVKKAVEPVILKTRESLCCKGTESLSKGKVGPVVNVGNTCAKINLNCSSDSAIRTTAEHAVGNDSKESCSASALALPNNISLKIGTKGTISGSASGMPELPVLQGFKETDKAWYYKDPSGNVQGPFPLMQLEKWTNYFPPDLRVWHASVNQENSVMLADVLSRFKKDLVNQVPQPTNAPNEIGLGLSSNSGRNDERGHLSDWNCGKEDACKIWSTAGPQVSKESIQIKQDSDLNRQPSAQQFQNSSSNSHLHPRNEFGIGRSHESYNTTGYTAHTVGEFITPVDTVLTSTEGKCSVTGLGEPSVSSAKDPCMEHNFPTVCPWPVNNSGPKGSSVVNQDSFSSAKVCKLEKSEDFEVSLTLASSSANKEQVASSNEKLHGGTSKFAEAPEPNNEQMAISEKQGSHHQQHPVTLLRPEHPEPFVTRSALKSLESSVANLSADAQELSNGNRMQLPPRMQGELVERSSVGCLETNRESLPTETGKAANSAISDQISSDLELLPVEGPGIPNMHMPQIAKLDELAPVPAEQEDAECCSVIAVSPWSDRNFFPAESINSPIWDAQDDLQSDLWSLPSPTPGSKNFVQGHESESTAGHEAVGKSTAGAHLVTSARSDVAAVPNSSKGQSIESGNSAFGAAQQVKNFDKNFIAGPLYQQVPKQSTVWDIPAEGVSAVQSNVLSATNVNYRPLSGRDVEAPRIDNCHWGSGPGSVGKGWTVQGREWWSASRKHHDDRYQDERHAENGGDSWHGSGNYPRNRLDSHSGGFSKSSRVQSQRGICKFYGNGFCRKGTSCKYLHQ